MASIFDGKDELERKALAGNIDAVYVLGTAYLMKDDTKTAIEYFKIAAASGL